MSGHAGHKRPRPACLPALAWRPSSDQPLSQHPWVGTLAIAGPEIALDTIGHSPRPFTKVHVPRVAKHVAVRPNRSDQRNVQDLALHFRIVTALDHPNVLLPSDDECAAVWSVCAPPLHSG